MFAIVGLGNPGDRYRLTRHNLGARVVEALGRDVGCSGHNDAWKKLGSSSVLKTSVAAESCVLVLPHSYMNLSGEAVVPVVRYFKLSSEDLIVIHDELDLEPGVLRLKKGGGFGGHRGLKSIASHLGTADFYRLRVGIGHPRDFRARMQAAEGSRECAECGTTQGRGEASGAEDVSHWVLSKPGAGEDELLEKAICIGVEAVKSLVCSGLEAAQREFHKKGIPL